MNCDWYISELEALEREGMLRSIPSIEGQGRCCRKGGRELLNLSSNDYLGLFERSDLVEEFMLSFKVLPKFSSASSRLLTGNCAAAQAAEERLAQMYGKQSALLFNSGYHANVGVVSTIATPGSYIIADRSIHASMIDGMRLSGAKFTRFRHNDIEHLESIIKRVQGLYSQVIIITEGIFSMGGDRGRVADIVALKQRYDNLVIYIDEAHSFGVCGSSGLGVCEEIGAVDGVDIIVGTFGKAICSVGAFVVLPSVLRNYLINKARPLIFSTALPPINIEWSRFVVERLDSFSAERERLRVNSELLRSRLSQLGFNIESTSQIVGLTVGDASAAVNLYKSLEDRGFYALPVRPPTVAVGCSGVRFSLTAAIEQSEVEELCDAIKELI